MSTCDFRLNAARLLEAYLVLRGTLYLSLPFLNHMPLVIDHHLAIPHSYILIIDIRITYHSLSLIIFVFLSDLGELQFRGATRCH